MEQKYRAVHRFTRAEQSAEGNAIREFRKAKLRTEEEINCQFPVDWADHGILLDPLYVKNAEAILGRKLQQEELSSERFWAAVEGVGHEEFRISRLKFPWDLMVYPQEILGAMKTAPKNKLVKIPDMDQWKMRFRPPEYLRIWKWDRDNNTTTTATTGT